MNLQENIQRIKEVMGLSEQINPLLSWLKSKELIKYQQIFDYNGVDTIEKLKNLSSEDLKNMGVSLGDRKRFQIGMEEMRAEDEIKQKIPYKEKVYNPKNEADFSNSFVKNVVWRVGEVSSRIYTGGIWFAETKEGAENFSISVKGVEAKASPYYINITNPKIYESFWRGYLEEVGYDREGRDNLMRKLIKDGHDGIIIKTDTWNDTGDEYSVTSEQYIVFNPENIKSAE